MITEQQVIEVCKAYVDPELGIDVYTLGLIYEKKINENKVYLKMTFTSPFCPYGPQMIDELKDNLKEAGAEEVEIEVTFDPPWEPSEELKAMLGMP